MFAVEDSSTLYGSSIICLQRRVNCSSKPFFPCTSFGLFIKHSFVFYIEHTLCGNFRIMAHQKLIWFILVIIFFLCFRISNADPIPIHTSKWSLKRIYLCTTRIKSKAPKKLNVCVGMLHIENEIANSWVGLIQVS